ncbi:MAG: hypothetical protein ACI3Z7_05220 [Candidatus Aphodosoma sp.]
MPVLRYLPAEAECRSRSGQAEVTLRNRGDTVIITARCDSLQRRCEYFEAEFAQRSASYEKDLNDTATTTESRSSHLVRLIAAFIVGLATGIVSTILIKRQWKTKMY